MCPFGIQLILSKCPILRHAFMDRLNCLHLVYPVIKAGITTAKKIKAFKNI